MKDFKIACEMCFSFVADLGGNQSDYLAFCYEKGISPKAIEKYVDEHYEEF